MPDRAENDAGFVQEIFRLSHMGLHLIALLEIGVPIVLILAQLAIVRDQYAQQIMLAQSATLMMIGLATLTAWRSDWSYERSRPLGIASMMAVGFVMVTTSMLVITRVPEMGHYTPGRVSAIMMIAVAAIPMKPWQTCMLSGSIGVYYAAALAFMRSRGYLTGMELDAYDHVFMFLITLIATSLSAVVYRERLENYSSYLRSLQASAELRTVQSQMLLSESAASLGRLAAALSHELNTPLGVLRSGINTLALVHRRMSTQLADELESGAIGRLVRTQGDVCQGLDESVQRLQRIVERMQRYTNLDRSEVRWVDLGSLVMDVSALLEPIFSGRAKIESEVRTAVLVPCRPQQISAVISNLLSNAVEACAESCVIRITLRPHDDLGELTIEDNGRGLSSKELTAIFDPGFRVDGNRVSTGNWSLFGARQIVREHGGDIRLRSTPGVGTTVTLVLPMHGPLAALAPTPAIESVGAG